MPPETDINQRCQVLPCRKGAAFVPLAGKFILPRPLGQKPILPNRPIYGETSPDVTLSIQLPAISVAAISTKNLSALVSQ